MASSIFVIEYCASETFFVSFVFKKSLKESLKVMINLAPIFLYEFENTSTLFSENEKAKADRDYSH